MSDITNKKETKFTKFIISLCFSAVILGAGFIFVETVSFHKMAVHLFYPLIRLMFFIFLGLVVGQIIESTGWTGALSVIARPFFRFGKLGDRCSAAFTSAFVSGIAANAILLDFYKENKITKKQMFLTNFVNQMPNYFLHLPTTFFIVWPLTGVAGVIYLIITFTAVLLRTSLFLVYGRLTIKEEITKKTVRDSKNSNTPKRSIFKNIRDKLPERFMNIAMFVLPVYIAVFVFTQAGIFKLANELLIKFIPVTFIPVEAFSVVVLSFFTEFTSGFAAAGAMMDSGLLTVKQTVTALLIGNIAAFPLRALRHQLPRYIGIFSPKLGTEILLIGQISRVLSLILMGSIYYLVF